MRGNGGTDRLVSTAPVTGTHMFGIRAMVKTIYEQMLLVDTNTTESIWVRMNEL